LLEAAGLLFIFFRFFCLLHAEARFVDCD
jgi:hypothetical protein